MELGEIAIVCFLVGLLGSAGPALAFMLAVWLASQFGRDRD